MSLIITSAIATALTDEVIARSLAMMDNNTYLDERRKEANDNIALEKPSPFSLPAVDALLAGTIGLGLGHQASKLSDSLGGKINMDSLLSGSDFKKPSFVTAMKTMGSISPSLSPCTSPNVPSFEPLMLAA